MRKRALFEALADVPLSSAKDVLKLHELLVFAPAYPDYEGVLASVETVLAAFESRLDLRRHRWELANSGIAGTEIRYKFFYPTAVALARRFPRRLRIDWRVEVDAVTAFQTLLRRSRSGRAHWCPWL